MQHRGCNCSLARAMDGSIMRRGIISSCQSAVTSKIVKRFWILVTSSRVSSAIASTRPLPLPFYLYPPTLTAVLTQNLYTRVYTGLLGRGLAAGGPLSPTLPLPSLLLPFHFLPSLRSSPLLFLRGPLKYSEDLGSGVRSPARSANAFRVHLELRKLVYCCKLRLLSVEQHVKHDTLGNIHKTNRLSKACFMKAGGLRPPRDLMDGSIKHRL